MVQQGGRLAQLGERCVRNAEVRSSILLPSTNLRSRQSTRASVGEPILAKVVRRSPKGEGGLSNPSHATNQAHRRAHRRRRRSGAERRHPRGREIRLQCRHRGAGHRRQLRRAHRARPHAGARARRTSPEFCVWAARFSAPPIAAIPFAYPVSTSDGKVDYSARVIENFHKFGLDALVVIGGDGTLAIAHELSEEGHSDRRRAENDRQRHRRHRQLLRVRHRRELRHRRHRSAAYHGRSAPSHHGGRGDGTLCGVDRAVRRRRRRRGCRF